MKNLTIFFQALSLNKSKKYIDNYIYVYFFTRAPYLPID